MSSLRAHAHCERAAGSCSLRVSSRSLLTLARGRMFHRCGLNSGCNMFGASAASHQPDRVAWEDEIEKQRAAMGFHDRLDGGNSLGQSQSSQSQSRNPPSTPSSSRNAAASAAIARAASSSPSKRKARASSEELWDDIDDIDEDDISTLDSQSQATSSKRQRFDSFGGGKPSTYDQIRNDPSSPFHATLQRVTAASTPVAGSSSSPTAPASGSSPGGGAAAALEALKVAEGAHETVRSALERFERLLKASNKRCDVLVEAGKKRDGEIEALQARVRCVNAASLSLSTAARPIGPLAGNRSSSS